MIDSGSWISLAAVEFEEDGERLSPRVPKASCSAPFRFERAPLASIRLQSWFLLFCWLDWLLKWLKKLILPLYCILYKWIWGEEGTSRSSKDEDLTLGLDPYVYAAHDAYLRAWSFSNMYPRVKWSQIQRLKTQKTLGARNLHSRIPRRPKKDSHRSLASKSDRDREWNLEWETMRLRKNISKEHQLKWRAREGRS